MFLIEQKTDLLITIILQYHNNNIYFFSFKFFLFFFVSCFNFMSSIIKMILLADTIGVKPINGIGNLLIHILKLFNIFHHIVNNIRPVYIPKGQKNDLFIGTKEIQQMNSFGYFGNDFFYLKLYNLMKLSYDGYKVSEILFKFICFYHFVYSIFIFKIM